MTHKPARLAEPGERYIVLGADCYNGDTGLLVRELTHEEHLDEWERCPAWAGQSIGVVEPDTALDPRELEGPPGGPIMAQRRFLFAIEPDDDALYEFENELIADAINELNAGMIVPMDRAP